MLKGLLAAFVVIPVVELVLLILLGNALGFWPTLGLVIATGIAGGMLAKYEGLRVWRDWRASLAEGRTPESGVLEGVLVLVGAILLITPGVLTDVLGVLLMVRPARRRVAAFVRGRIDRALKDGTLRVSTIGFGTAGPRPPSRRPRPPLRDVADAELVD